MMPAVADAELFEQGFGPCAAFFERAAGVNRGHLDIFRRRCCRQKVVALEHKTERIAA